MGRLQALTLAGTIALGAAPAVHAADLLPPAPQLEPYPAPLESSGWYLRGDVGVGATSLGKVTSTFQSAVPSPNFDQTSLGDSAFVDIGAGYKFNNWLRADVTGEYRTAERYSAVESYANNFGNAACGARCYDTYGASVSNAVFLANGYVDLGTWANITPYVGVGVGFANTSIAGLYDVSAQPTGGFGFAGNTSSWNFAWALMAGLSYTVTPNLSLELGYRYLDMGTAKSGQITCQNQPVGCPNEIQSFKVASQDIKLGMRWMFGEAAPEPMPEPIPQAPLVRKY